LHLALKINCCYFNIKTGLVNTIKNRYNLYRKRRKGIQAPVIRPYKNMRKTLELIHKNLVRSKKTLGVAESCTGGLLSAALTSLPGSSAYFILGAVTYHNKAKQAVLKIPLKTLNRYGAVSRQTALLMAVNIRKKTGSDFGLSVTGIAGPSGATPGKPLGTVYICLSKNNKTDCRKFIFRGSRHSIRRQSVQNALNLLCAHLSP